MHCRVIGPNASQQPALLPSGSIVLDYKKFVNELTPPTLQTLGMSVRHVKGMVDFTLGYDNLDASEWSTPELHKAVGLSIIPLRELMWCHNMPLQCKPTFQPHLLYWHTYFRANRMSVCVSTLPCIKLAATLHPLSKWDKVEDTSSAYIFLKIS